MEWIEVIVLGLIQGLTEFLPISSSAHLLLVPILTNWQDQGLVFDVALHLGSLLAVILYFRKEIDELWIGWWQCVLFRKHSKQSRLAWGVLIGTIPVGCTGLLFNPYIETEMRTGVYMAYSLIGFGLVLGWADWRYSRGQQQALKPTLQNEYEMNWKQIGGIACAQMLALIPGTSRSGATMTAGLMLGLTREASARFSFLLSIPVIVLATSLQGKMLYTSSIDVNWWALAVGVMVSFLSAYICIHYFLTYIKRAGMQPFVIYRVLLGLYLLYVLK